MAELKMMAKMCLQDVNQMTINISKHKGKVARYYTIHSLTIPHVDLKVKGERRRA
jgi:hypothetical protein